MKDPSTDVTDEEKEGTMTEVGDPRAYAIIGAAMEVHSELGPGYQEPVYQDALEVEMQLQEISCRREVELQVPYKGRILAHTYRADFICFGNVVGSVAVETKALDRLSGKEESQLLNYLKASGIPTGLLLNFGAARLEYKRMVL